MSKASLQISWPEVEQLLASSDAAALQKWLTDLEPAEIPRVLALLSEHGRADVLASLRPTDAAHLVTGLSDAQAADLLDDLVPTDAAAILHELASNDQADLIQEMVAADAEAILEALDPTEAATVRDLARFPADTAGGLMVTEYLAFGADATAGFALETLRARSESVRDFEVQYLYVVDDARRLIGVLRVRDLVLAPLETLLRTLMATDLSTVPETATLDELEQRFEDRAFFGIPVLDAAGRLSGIVRRSDVLEAIAERAGSDYLKTQGVVGGEELRSMPVLRRARRRLSWLSINIVLNMIAASVIAAYQDTLAQVIALAVFLPIISDMSGCSGNQAAAVSMRELSLGLVRPQELLRTWWNELSVGLINGMVLGALLAVAAYLWQGNPALGLVVGGALAINTLVAVSIGGTVPLILRRFGFDPALASGPILTTITDLCGFLLALSFAAAALPHLTA